VLKIISPQFTKAGADIEPIVVLDLIMPNGKRMRDCTGTEMKRFGDLFLRRQRGEDNDRLFSLQ
jgi:hypothetical protein